MLRDAIADSINGAVGGVIDAIMKGIWAAAVWLLRTVFQLVDSFTTITFVSDDGGIDPASPIASIWPMLRWLSLAIALGLFFLQLITTMLRGGRGLFRLATGPLAYALAVGMTAGGFALLFAAGDGITAILLDQGLKTDGFVGVLDSTAAAKVFIPSPDLGADPVAVKSAAAVASQLDATARAWVLGLVALFWVIPAGLGFLLESLFRAAVFLVLVATSPITAAGLLADATASWFWRQLRWAIAAAGLKPALALVLVIGVNMLSKPTGLQGLLVGAGVLLVALFCPFVLYRLLAFVDPGTNAGAAARSFLSGSGGRGGPAGDAVAADGDGPGAGAEVAHAARFDAAGGGAAGGGAAGGGAAGGGAAGGGAAGGGAAGGAAAGGAAGGAAAAAGAVVGVAAATMAVGRAAGQYANQMMDASGIGSPHGGHVAHHPPGHGGNYPAAGSIDGGGGGGGDGGGYELDTVGPDDRAWDDDDRGDYDDYDDYDGYGPGASDPGLEDRGYERVHDPRYDSAGPP